MRVGDRVEIISEPIISILKRKVVGLKGTIVRMPQDGYNAQIRMDEQVIDPELQKDSTLSHCDWFVPGHNLGLQTIRFKVIDEEDSPTYIKVPSLK